MMPAPPPWQFRCYVSGDGTDEVRTWYEESNSKDIRSKFFSRLRALSGLPFQEWRPPIFRWLDDGIGEIRFKADRVQQWPLGFRGPGENQFTIVFCATEKGDRFVPRDAIQRAIDRKSEIERHEATSTPCWLLTDT